MKLPTKFRERYEPIAPEGFFAALESGLPKTFRVNSLKSTTIEIVEYAQSQGWQLKALPWYPEAFTIDREDRSVPLGHTLPHFTGRLYIQEASSMVPPAVLDPQPGERVLDLAAAPGSKTTQLAAMMDNQGLLVANDSSATRIKALTANLERIGTLNTVVTNVSGHRLGRLVSAYFDKVLLDAPCTAEGTIAKNPELTARWSENAVIKLSTLQGKLLLGAWEAVKPGGVLVYSTCTFAPEENEGVLSSFLKLHPEATIEPFDLPGLPAAPGITEWQGETYDAQVAGARRIWPGQAAMEGFFIAKLRKAEGSAEPTYKMFGDRRYEDALDAPGEWLGERFGLPAGWDGELVWRAKDEERWLMTPEAAAFNYAPIVRRGLRAARTVRQGYKPTTDWMQLVGNQVTLNVVDTDAGQTQEYLAGQDLAIDAELGYVALRHEGVVYAVGLAQPGNIKNQLQVSRRILHKV